MPQFEYDPAWVRAVATQLPEQIFQRTQIRCARSKARRQLQEQGTEFARAFKERDGCKQAASDFLLQGGSQDHPTSLHQVGGPRKSSGRASALVT